MSNPLKSRKKILRVLLIIGGVLLVGLVGAVIYFYTLKGPGDNTQTTQVACGCYVIDPNVIKDCGDPKRAFIFNINRVTSDQNCSAVCDLNQISENLLNSTTPKESYKSCTVKSLSDTRCENMQIKDQDGKIITGKISETDEINIEATFDKSTYTNYIFKINNVTTNPDKIDGNKITGKITDLGDANSIEIVATATDSLGENINSLVCRRIVDITRGSTADVNSLTVTTAAKADESTEITAINISVGELTSENVKVKFSFNQDIPSIIATKGLTISSNKGNISMNKADAYTSSNFENNKDFSILDEYTGDIEITAEVFVDNNSIGTAKTSIDYAEVDDTDDPQEPSPDDQTTQSEFSVIKSVTPTCVERVNGSNTATFTITVTNSKESADTITYIKDKLPLGFTYTTESTQINGTAVSDTSLVTVTPVGDSQEIVWQPTNPWSINANSTLKIEFITTAGANALTGVNQNEVIVNPTEIPLDPSKLRAQASITVAQDCQNPPTNDVGTNTPSTGILDNMIIRILLGLIVISTGWFVYTRPEGTELSEKIVSSNAYKDLELTKYKITNPRKYFEEKTLRNKSKEN